MLKLKMVGTLFLWLVSLLMFLWFHPGAGWSKLDHPPNGE